jgi:hypothetical protein
VSVIEESVSVAPPGFDTVVEIAEEVVETSSFPKDSEVGLKLIPAVPVPIPLSGAVCGEPAALSVMVKVPTLAPMVVGVKVTFTVQVPEGTTVVQLLVCEKSPEMEIFEMIRFPDPVFVTVIGCETELVPTV